MRIASVQIILVSLTFLLSTVSIARGELEQIVLECDTEVSGYDQFCSPDGDRCDPKNTFTADKYPSVVKVYLAGGEVKRLQLHKGGSTSIDSLIKVFTDIQPDVSGDKLLGSYDYSVNGKTDRGSINLHRYTGDILFEEQFGGKQMTQINYIWTGKCTQVRKLF